MELEKKLTDPNEQTLPEAPASDESKSVVQEVEAPAIDPIPEGEQSEFEEKKLEEESDPKYVFNFIMHQDGSLEFKNFSKEDYSIMELLGASMHFIFGGTKKVYDKTIEEHPELTEEQKKSELHDMAVYNFVTSQMLIMKVLVTVFGELDEKMFNEKLEYARNKQEEFIIAQEGKARDIEKKITKHVKK